MSKKESTRTEIVTLSEKPRIADGNLIRLRWYWLHAQLFDPSTVGERAALLKAEKDDRVQLTWEGNFIVKAVIQPRKRT